MKTVKKGKNQLSPFFIIILSFFLLIVIGTILFSLPFSTKNGHGLSFTNAFFLATSSVTVTGLAPETLIVPSLSVFGKIVLALLIQIGGIGVITISVFIMSLLGAKIGIADRVLLRENFNASTLSGIVKLLRKIVIFTFAIELIGFQLNFIVFADVLPLGEAVATSAIVAITSFNNAGFSGLFDTSIITYTSHPLLAINTMVLVMLGGLGFVVIFDLIENKRWKRLSIHSKIVITMNLILWISGALVLKLGQIRDGSFSWQSAFFLSIGARTAGINVVEMQSLTMFSLLSIIILMFIGGSPTSTAGGIKTTTLFTLIKTMFSYATGTEVTTNKRRISEKSQTKAFMIFFMVTTTIVSGALLILLFDNVPLGTALFEAVSATTNTGYTITPTEDLTIVSKFILAILMFIGRVGPLTLITIFNRNWYRRSSANVTFLEETIIIG